MLYHKFFRVSTFIFLKDVDILNSNVPTIEGVFKAHGNVTVRMTVEIGVMKEIVRTDPF